MTESETKSTASSNDEIVADEPLIEEAVSQQADLPPDMPELSLEALQTELETLKQQSMSYFDRWQRERADFANYKKRMERERSESYQRAALDTIIKLIPIIDDFERAMTGMPEDFSEHPWISGISLIQRKFEKLLDDHNVSRIDPEGEPFDPSRHEAISMESSDTVESGRVIATLQKGYAAEDRILRPALVKVAN